MCHNRGLRIIGTEKGDHSISETSKLFAPVLEWSPDGGYVIHRTEIDDHQTHKFIKTPPLLASEMLVQSALPLFLKSKRRSHKAKKLPLLSMHEGEFSIEGMTITTVHTVAQAQERVERQWHIHFQRLGGATEYIYHFDRNGLSLSMHSGQRKVVAEGDARKKLLGSQQTIPKN